MTRDRLSRFRELTELRSWYDGLATDRLTGFYLPTLRLAARYDRLVGYWRSSSLVVAASAIAELARREGKMRIIAGAELTEDDIQAIRAGQPLDDALARRIIEVPDEAGDIVADHRYEVLAWMLKERLLEIRIGVPVDKHGEPMGPAEASKLFHSKFGVFEDEYGDQIVMSGSSNESAKGWIENHESFHVFKSWGPTETWTDSAFPVIQSFNRHWNEEIPGWKVMPFPDAARDHLLARAPASEGWIPPRDPLDTTTTAEPDDLDELKWLVEAPMIGGGSGVAFETAPIDAWPHQRSIASRILGTWPRSYLLADEVGLGKTIEAGLVIKELLLTGKASRILILVPASVQKQWQEELWEKFGLDVPSYESNRFYRSDRSEINPPTGVRPWAAFPVVLASSHLARMRRHRTGLIEAGPWDLVLVDEAHHARRRGSQAAEGANQLLQLLRAMKSARSWKTLVLATATPMQMHTSELFDLLDLFDLPGLWASGEASFESYYRQLAEPDLQARNWTLMKRLLADHMAAPGVEPNPVALEAVTSGLSAPKAMKLTNFHRLPIPGTALTEGLSAPERELVDRWFRSNTPIKDRIFRTSREALREYQRQGILPPASTIPTREVFESFIVLSDEEKQLYDRIESYISRYYEAYTKDRKTRPLGFIMTVYRRRLTSSFNAVYRSFQRRLEALKESQGNLGLLVDDDDRAALEGVDYEPDELESAIALMEEEIAELESFVSELHKALPNDTKVKTLIDDIQNAFKDGHQTIVVFTQYTDTLEWLRDELKGTYGEQIACYTGKGGSRWNSTSQTWMDLSKEEVKTLFRRGEDVRILLGTDAMSEGLNLQTSDRMINYDMPWNFMRVEQRIGRIDRINGQPNVKITNYFYRDTVEEQVYRGIQEDAEWFQHVVGPAQPVLGRVEDVIQHLAMQPSEGRQQQLQQELDEVRAAIHEAKNRPIDLKTMEDTELPQPGGYGSMPVVTLDGIARILITNPLTKRLFHPHPDFENTYFVEHEGNKVPMTFNRTVYDNNPEIGFLTYDHPVFDGLLRCREC